MQPLKLSSQPHFSLQAARPRFGNQEPQPSSQENAHGDEATFNAKLNELQIPEAPKRQPNWLTQLAGIAGGMLHPFYALVAPKRAMPAPQSDTSAKTDTSAVAPAKKSERVKSAEPAKPVSEGAQPKTGFLKKCANFALGLALNGFHVGAALFILAGIPLLHAPIWIGLGSLLGVQLFQSFVDRNQSWLEDKFPHFSVRNPEHMRLMTRAATRRINRAMITGRNVLRKIPLINRLVPLYVGAAARLRNIARKGMNFATKNLLTGTINASKIPDHVWKQGFWGKAFYFTRVILANTLQLITGPFGKIGEWIYKGGVILFRLHDAASYVDAFASTTKLDPTSDASAAAASKSEDTTSEKVSAPKRRKKTAPKKKSSPPAQNP